MKLIFNAESLRPPVTGVGYYSLNLLEQFLRSDEVEVVYCFTGTQWRDGAAQLAATRAMLNSDADELPSAMQRFRAVIRQLIGRVPGSKTLYDRLMTRRFTSRANCIADAIYHETNYVLKPYGGPCVTTVHDLSHIRYPQHHPEHVVARLNRYLPQSLARADAVITVSNVVRDEVLEHFDVPPSRVHTIYEGVDPRYRPRSSAETAAVLRHYGLAHQQYVLLVATLEPRKGIDILLAAWEQLPETIWRTFPLILTGASGWRNRELRERLAKLQQKGAVRHLGYVPEADLPLLYSGAAVFCYPSIYEGFGLPVLDAMSSGVPVICRQGTSMAEFADGACVLLEGADPGELSDRLVTLLRNVDARSEWGRRGRERAAAFSWGRCARETAAVYRRVC